MYIPNASYLLMTSNSGFFDKFSSYTHVLTYHWPSKFARTIRRGKRGHREMSEQMDYVAIIVDIY